MKLTNKRKRLLIQEFDSMHEALAKILRILGEHEEGKAVAVQFDEAACLAMRKLRVLYSIPYLVVDLKGGDDDAE